MERVEYIFEYPIKKSFFLALLYIFATPFLAAIIDTYRDYLERNQNVKGALALLLLFCVFSMFYYIFDIIGNFRKIVIIITDTELSVSKIGFILSTNSIVQFADINNVIEWTGGNSGDYLEIPYDNGSKCLYIYDHMLSESSSFKVIRDIIFYQVAKYELQIIDYDEVPWYRKKWFMYTCVLLFPPASVVILWNGSKWGWAGDSWTGESYYVDREGCCKSSLLNAKRDAWILSILLTFLWMMWMAWFAVSTWEKVRLQKEAKIQVAVQRQNEAVAKKKPLIQHPSGNSASMFRVINIDKLDTLNVRTKASPRSSVIYRIPFNGDCIAGTEETQIYLNKVWRKITVNHYTGWVNSEFLSATNSVCNAE